MPDCKEKFKKIKRLKEVTEVLPDVKKSFKFQKSLNGLTFKKKVKYKLSEIILLFFLATSRMNIIKHVLLQVC